MQIAVKAAAAKAGAPLSNAEVERAADEAIRAMMLIRTYRVRGHLAANLDPLGLSKRELPADLTPEYHGFVGADQDRPVYLGGTLGLERSEEHTSELQSLMRISYAVFCLKKKKRLNKRTTHLLSQPPLISIINTQHLHQIPTNSE